MYSGNNRVFCSPIALDNDANSVRIRRQFFAYDAYDAEKDKTPPAVFAEGVSV